MQNGTVFTNVSYSFTPVDRASAIASIMTGTSPYYNGVIGTGWLDKKTLRPVSCVDDPAYPGLYTTESSSPKGIRTSTITDELKVTLPFCQQDMMPTAPYGKTRIAADGAPRPTT